MPRRTEARATQQQQHDRGHSRTPRKAGYGSCRHDRAEEQPRRRIEFQQPIEHDAKHHRKRDGNCGTPVKPPARDRLRQRLEDMQHDGPNSPFASFNRVGNAPRVELRLSLISQPRAGRCPRG